MVDTKAKCHQLDGTRRGLWLMPEECHLINERMRLNKTNSEARSKVTGAESQDRYSYQV